MRDINRIDEFCDELKSVWKERFSDWRFGQFMNNFLGWCISEKKCYDIFFPEDDKWLEWLKEYKG